MIRTGVRDVTLGALLLFGVAACTWTGMRSGDAVAQRVYVAGTLEHTSAARIARTAAPYLGVPFFDIDIDAMAAELKTLPWLAAISIDRHWPDGVVIRVTENKPIALWGNNEVLTANFTVIAPGSTADLPKLPHLSGPDGLGKRVYTRFVNMNQKLRVADNRHIEALVLDARGSWRATLDNGLVLRFGREHLATRLQRFINYALTRIPKVLADAGYVDLRYSDGFAVGGAQTAAAREKRNEQKA